MSWHDAATKYRRGTSRRAGQPLVLNGGGAYHAAVHCAAVAAAQRQVPPHGDRHRARRARRNGFFVRAARAVTRSLRGSGPGGSADAAMGDDHRAIEDSSSSDGDSPSLPPAGAAGSDASQHLPPTEAHVALVHPATDSPMAPPPVAGAQSAGTPHSDAGAEPTAVPAQPLSPKAGVLPASLLATSVASPVS